MEGEELRGRKREEEEEKGRGKEREAGERGEDKKSLSGGGMMGVVQETIKEGFLWNLTFSP